MKLRILRDIYKRECEHRLIYGAQYMGLHGGWEQNYEFQGDFQTKMFKNTKVCLQRIDSTEDGERKKEVEDTILCCEL
jgi:hypothetical protein